MDSKNVTLAPSIDDIRSATRRKDALFAQAVRDHLERVGIEDLQVAAASLLLFISVGQPDVALEMTERALRNFPDDPRLLYHKATLNVRLGDLRGSIPCFEKLNGLDPNNSATVSSYVTALARLNRFEEASALLTRYEEVNGFHQRTHFARCDFHIRLNDNVVARHHLEKHIDLYGVTVAVAVLYAATLCKVGLAARAIDFLQSQEATFGEDARFKTALRNATVELDRQAQVSSHTSTFEVAESVSGADYLIKGDLAFEFRSPSEALPIYLEGSEKFPHNNLLLARTISCLLAMGQTEAAQVNWRCLLSANADLEALLLLLDASIPVMNSETISEILNETEQMVSRARDPAFPRRIALLGGSNTIMVRGWAPAFIRLMARFEVQVENFGLGGISSLYGLSIAKRQKLFETYDLVIFEYTLNDVYFNEIGGYSTEMIRSMAFELGRSAREHNSLLLILELAPMSAVRKAIAGECEVANIYRSEAHRNGSLHLSASNLIREKCVSEPFINALYTDEMHHTTAFAKLIMASVAKLVLTNPRHPTGEQGCVEPKHYGPPFDFSSIRLASIREIAEVSRLPIVRRETNIIKDDFVRVPQSEVIRFILPAGRTLLGLLINSSVNTGYIKVRFGQIEFVKHIAALRPNADTEKARIFLRQFSTLLVASDATEVEITPSVSAQDLEVLPRDVTAYEGPLLVPLGQHELEVSSVLLS